jgi:hypothetical protein
MVQETGRYSCFVPGWRLKMACWRYGFSRDAQRQAIVNTSCWQKAFCTLNDVIEITNGQLWQTQNSSKNSVFLRGAECHCRVAEFLLHLPRPLCRKKKSHLFGLDQVLDYYPRGIAATLSTCKALSRPFPSHYVQKYLPVSFPSTFTYFSLQRSL